MKEIKEQVWKANLDLLKQGLVTLTFGNVSGFDAQRGVMVIKPSGMDYAHLKPEEMVVVDLDGRTVEGRLNPSSDSPTHLALYRAFPGLGGVAHSHSEYAVAFAQAGWPIPCLGTTHADYFHGEIPVTRWISASETAEDYEGNTGSVIQERFQGVDPLEVPAVLVAGHGPFVWGRSPEEAVVHSVVLEASARRAWRTLALNPAATELPGYLLEKHFQRKHGPDAYYGQTRKGAKS